MCDTEFHWSNGKDLNFKTHVKEDFVCLVVEQGGGKWKSSHISI